MIRLEAYPNLEKWYKDNEGLLGDFDSEPVERTVWNFLDCLVRRDSCTFVVWSTCLRRFFEVSKQPEENFYLLQKFFGDRGLDIFELFSSWGHQAFERRKEDEFLDMMDLSAQMTKADGFNFLAGWTAFNLNDFIQCIAYCDIVGEKFAPVLTLKGQAYLESGRADEASKTLLRATEIDPSDPLAWFLLAKSNWALGQFGKSELALIACQRHAGPSAEVALFLAIIALDDKNPRPNYEEPWRAMVHFLPKLGDNLEFVEKVILIGLRRGIVGDLEAHLKQISWSVLKEQLQGSPQLATILRGFGEAGWLKLSKIVLDTVVEDKPSDLET